MCCMMGMNVRNTGCRVRPQTAKLQALTTAQQQYSRVTETKQSSGLSTRCTIQPQKKRKEKTMPFGINLMRGKYYTRLPRCNHRQNVCKLLTQQSNSRAKLQTESSLPVSPQDAQCNRRQNTCKVLTQQSKGRVDLQEGSSTLVCPQDAQCNHRQRRL